MSDRTKCPRCEGKGTYSNDNGVYACKDCSGTGEVEPFWTREPPKKDGYYFVIPDFNTVDDITIVRIWESIIEIWGTESIYDYSDFKYWSREPIRFPESPEEQGDGT